MKNKSEVHTHLKQFLALIENLYGFKLKRIRTDNGPKIFLRDFYAQNDILHQTSCMGHHNKILRLNASINTF